MIRSQIGRLSWVAAVLTLAALGTGCSDNNKKQKKARRIEGIAHKIDLDTRQVSLKIVREDGTDDVLEGYFRDDTAVEINGRAQKFGDVREGDKIVAWVEKDKDEDRFIVVRVEVARPRASDWLKATGDDTTVEAVPTAVATNPPINPSASGANTSTADNPTPVEPTVSDRPPSTPLSVNSREDAEDLVYGLIRIRMEEAVVKRQNFIDAGRPLSAVEIRNLEGMIMKARSLLLEHGEYVEDVTPPIVESGPPS